MESLDQIALRIAVELNFETGHPSLDRHYVEFARRLVDELAKQKPVGYFYKDHNGDLRQAFDLQFKVAYKPLYALPPNQSARIAELEAEVARLKVEARDACFGLNDYHELKLAAAQAVNTKLRVAAQNVCSANNYTEASQAIRILNTQLLAHPSDNSALEAMLETERQKVAEACAVMCEDVIGNTAHDQRMLAAIDCAAMLRNGDWKGFVK